MKTEIKFQLKAHILKSRLLVFLVKAIINLFIYFFSPHPYLFFNPDHHTMTFLGFNIEKATGNLIDDQTGESLEDQIMDPTLDQRQRTLYNGLNSQPGVNLSENFDKLSR